MAQLFVGGHRRVIARESGFRALRRRVVRSLVGAWSKTRSIALKGSSSQRLSPHGGQEGDWIGWTRVTWVLRRSIADSTLAPIAWQAVARTPASPSWPACRLFFPKPRCLGDTLQALRPVGQPRRALCRAASTLLNIQGRASPRGADAPRLVARHRH